MKKVTGKALSLVLSLALVVSSFSATFANAATTKNEYLPAVDNTDTTVELVNGLSGDASKTDVTSKIPYQLTSADTTDHLKVGSLTATDIAYKSGSNLVSPSIDNSKVYVKLTSDTASGSEVVAVRYTATSQRYTDLTQNILFSVEVDYTIKVYQNNSYIITGLSDVDKDSNNAGASISGGVSLVTRDTGSLAKKVPQTVVTRYDKDSNYTPNSADLPNADGVTKTFFVKAVYSSGQSVTTSGNTFTANLTHQTSSEFLNVGSVVFYATPIKSNSGAAAVDNANTITATKSVKNTVTVPAGSYIKSWHGATWILSSKTESDNLKESTDGVNVLDANGVSSNVKGPYSDAINVTGANLDLAGSATMENGSVGTVTGVAGATLTLNKGYVSTIDDSDAMISLSMSNGSVGTIKKAASVTVYGGTVGAIKATTISVDATDEKITTTVGALTAKDVTVNSSKAAVTTGTITETISNDIDTVTNGPSTVGIIKVMGSSTHVGTIDCSYYAANIDLAGYKGSLVAPLNAGSASITTEVLPTDSTVKADVTVTGNADVKNLTLTDGTLTVANSIKAADVTGAGTLVIPAGGLYVSDTMNSVSLKLSNKTITPGMTVFTAAANKLYDGMFKTIGFTIDYDAISALTSTRTTDTFKVKAVNFAGLTIAPATGTSNKIVKGDKVTYNVSAYPYGTKLPDGKAIQITFSGSSDNFSYTTTADSITITANKYDDLFSSLNKGTITATLVDATTGAQDYTIDPATYDVQMIKTPEVSFKSDTTGNLNKKIGETYQFKITSADGSAPVFAVASNGATVVANGKSGNDYFFKVTPTKVGSFGVYVSGTKVAVLVVTSGVKCDTSKVTVAAGKTYQFKVTASAQPTFVVATVGTIKLASKNGNDYFYKVTATKTAGAHGVYINGVLTAVITFA